jgi:hypothetical protein
MPNATVIPPSVINVRVGTTNAPVATAISYGGVGRFELKAASDLSMVGAQTGDTIVYVSETNSFVIQTPASVARVNGGEY